MKLCVLPSFGLEIEVPVHEMHLLFIDFFTWFYKVRNFDFQNLEYLSYVPSWDSYQFYDEIDSGSAYHCFQQKRILLKFLWYFSNDTVVNKAGHHSFNPFMFTLGIFKQSLRRKQTAWRNLGFIKNNAGSKFTNAERA